MVSIQDELAKIINEKYLSKITQAIHDAIQKTYDDASANGNANMEVEMARGTEPTLNDRLGKMDDKDDEVTAQLAQTATLSKKINAQTDFVDIALRNVDSYETMTLLKTGSTAYQVQLYNNEDGLIYSFAKDNNDDFIKLTALYKGIVVETGQTYVDKEDVSEANTTGTFTQSGVTWYTTTPGNTFNPKSNGEKLVLVIHKESRGGIWSVKVDDRPPITVSCYSDTVVAEEVVIAENLENIEHTVICTFLGDDPNNPPSASPSRGYIRFVGEAQKGTLTGYTTAKRLDVDGTYLAENSNKEFAFIPIKNGMNNWVPEHNGIGSVFNIENPKFFVNELPFDAASMPTGSSNAVQIESFELKQYFNAHVVGYGAVAEVETSHKINKQGLMDFDGSLKAVADFEINVFYPLMMPSSAQFMNDFVTGIFNKKTNDATESYSYFNEEQDGVFNGAIISQTNKDMLVAGKLKNAIKTYRIGQNGKPPLEESLFLWNRVNQPKLYFESMKNKQMNINDYYYWGFELTAIKMEGIYNQINS